MKTIRSLCVLVVFLIPLCDIKSQVRVPGPGGGIISAGGTVTLDVVGAGTTMIGSTTIAANHTVTNGLTDTAVVALVQWELDSATVTSCTYNGNAMTQMWNYRETLAGVMGSAGFVYANGVGDGSAHSVSCTFPVSQASAGAALTTVSFYNVNQSTPSRTAATTPASYDCSSTTSISLVVGSATNTDQVVDGYVLYNDNPATATTTKTVVQNHANVQFNNFATYTSRAAATGSTTMGYTIGNKNPHYCAYGAAPIAHD